MNGPFYTITIEVTDVDDIKKLPQLIGEALEEECLIMGIDVKED